MSRGLRLQAAPSLSLGPEVVADAERGHVELGCGERASEKHEGESSLNKSEYA